jgi:HEAT repeat protein
VAGLGRRRALEPALVLHNLVRLGEAAVPGLLWGLDDRKPAVRAVCVDALGLIGTPRAAEPLTLLLDEDPDDEVRVRAARALTRLGSAALRAAVAVGGPAAAAPTSRRGRTWLPAARPTADAALPAQAHRH